MEDDRGYWTFEFVTVANASSHLTDGEADLTVNIPGNVLISPKILQFLLDICNYFIGSYWLRQVQ